MKIFTKTICLILLLVISSSLLYSQRVNQMEQKRKMQQIANDIRLLDSEFEKELNNPLNSFDDRQRLTRMQRYFDQIQTTFSTFENSNPKTALNAIANTCNNVRGEFYSLSPEIRNNLSNLVDIILEIDKICQAAGGESWQ